VSAGHTPVGFIWSTLGGYQSRVLETGSHDELIAAGGTCAERLELQTRAHG
jgi:hypothetical protein